MQRIGRVYAKVLKFKPQAKEYYKRAVQMAISMAPSICTFTTFSSELFLNYSFHYKIFLIVCNT